MLDLTTFRRRLFGAPPSPAVLRRFKDILEGKRPVPRRRGLVERRLRECVCAGATAGDARPVLANVKILGGGSANRRRYLPEAMREAAPRYEGVVVNIDHSARPGDGRSVKDRFGRLVNVRFEGGELRADLHYNPKHPMAAAVRWFAENDPDCLGMSHNVVGQGRTEAGVFVVEKIVSVRSVDLVADPATTKGLFA